MVGGCLVFSESVTVLPRCGRIPSATQRIQTEGRRDPTDQMREFTCGSGSFPSFFVPLSLWWRLPGLPEAPFAAGAPENTWKTCLILTYLVSLVALIDFSPTSTQPPLSVSTIHHPSKTFWYVRSSLLLPHDLDSSIFSISDKTRLLLDSAAVAVRLVLTLAHLIDSFTRLLRASTS